MFCVSEVCSLTIIILINILLIKVNLLGDFNLLKGIIDCLFNNGIKNHSLKKKKGEKKDLKQISK